MGCCISSPSPSQPSSPVSGEHVDAALESTAAETRRLLSVKQVQKALADWTSSEPSPDPNSSNMSISVLNSEENTHSDTLLLEESDYRLGDVVLKETASSVVDSPVFELNRGKSTVAALLPGMLPKYLCNEMVHEVEKAFQMKKRLAMGFVELYDDLSERGTQANDLKEELSSRLGVSYNEEQLVLLCELVSLVW
jgi:hypothetical protein